MTDHRATAIVVAGAACEIRIGDEKIRDSFSGDNQPDSMAYALDLLGFGPADWPDRYVLHTLGLIGASLEIQPCALGEIGIFPRIGHAGRLYVLDESRPWDWRDVRSDER